MLDYGKLRRALQTAFIAGLSGCLMNPAALAQNSIETPKPLVFDAATIKPSVPYGYAGLNTYPGGRIFFGGYIKWLIGIAFNLQDYQVAGGPNWVSSQWFEINAVPPEASPSRSIKLQNVEPTSEQRLMLQSLLRDRFGFEFHFEMKQGEVYILSRGTAGASAYVAERPGCRSPRHLTLTQGWHLGTGKRRAPTQRPTILPFD